MRGQFATPDGVLVALHIELLSHQRMIPDDRMQYIAELIREGRRLSAEQASPTADPSHALLLQLAASQALNLRALSALSRASHLLRTYEDATSSEETREQVGAWRATFNRWLASVEAQP